MKGHGIRFAEAVIDNGSFGTRVVRFETGRLAQQAGGSATAYLDGETVLLSATTIGRNLPDGGDSFPLTVEVEERSYATSASPGSFTYRPGRLATDTILTSRMVDRPLRPLFVSGLHTEVQVIIIVLTVDPDDSYDALAINAASMSTQLAGLPFSGPVAGVSLALVDGQWIAFPRHSEKERAVFGMVVSGRIAGDDVAIVTIEAEATEDSFTLISEGAQAPTEEIVAQGLEAAKPFLRALCEAQSELAAQAAKQVQELPRFLRYQGDALTATADAVGTDLIRAITAAYEQGGENLAEALADAAHAQLPVAHAQLDAQFEGREGEINGALRALTRDAVRRRMLSHGVRIDGRGLSDIRPLSADVGVLPRVHGSAIFQRGETQVVGVTTLTASGEGKRYEHHCNGLPFATGETGSVGIPTRREIDQGALAERALVPVLPTREEFAYTIRQVSELLGSNGSASMAAVCASTLSMLNAGVPLRAPVAGIAMGLVSDTVDGEIHYAALTDSLSSEDTDGDMDLNVAGTSEFITAIHLDTRLQGIPSSVIAGALSQARDARIRILEVMALAIR